MAIQNNTCIICGVTLPPQNKMYCSNTCKGVDNRTEHKIVEGIECKWCNRCEKWYSLRMFNKGKEWDGLREMCKHCLKLDRFKYKEKNYKNWSESKIIDKIYNTYKKSARDRGFVFDIKKEDFISLIYGNCAYCGSHPILKTHKSNNRRGLLASNGIDRENNNKGYLLSNCVSCCETCNKMKLQMSVKEFTTHIAKIYNNFK